jgi:hypothetical protein
MQDNYSNKNKWHLMLCELHLPTMHGKTDNSDPNIETHYLIHDLYNPTELYETNNSDSDSGSDDENNSYNKIYNAINYLKRKYLYLTESDMFNPILYTHPTIRNYYNIVSNTNYIQPEIGEYIILPTLEAVAILKTFWIRIIQKKWKKVFEQQQQIINERCKLQSLIYRQTTGYWPSHCKTFPTLKGMLHKLKK